MALLSSPKSARKKTAFWLTLLLFIVTRNLRFFLVFRFKYLIPFLIFFLCGQFRMCLPPPNPQQASCHSIWGCFFYSRCLMFSLTHIHHEKWENKIFLLIFKRRVKSHRTQISTIEMPKKKYAVIGWKSASLSSEGRAL